MKLQVMGLGKVGSVVAALYASAGHEVYGYDPNSHVVDKIRAREAPFSEPGLQELLEQCDDRLHVSADLASTLGDADVSIIIVPTPSSNRGDFRNDFVLEAVAGALRHIGSDKDHTIVIASTVMPGTCADVIQAAVGELRAGSAARTGLVYSPEFIALGSVVADMCNPDVVLIGSDDSEAVRVVIDLKKSILTNSPAFQVMSLSSAEVAKIALNTFITTKISFANMVGELCSEIPGANAAQVLAAVGADRRVGSLYLRPGLGYGGPCFPRDNRALVEAGRSRGVSMPIAKATDEVNDNVPSFFVNTIAAGLPNGGRVAVAGLSYKAETPVCEESQSIAIANQLSRGGFEVRVFDPEALLQADQHLRPTIQRCASIMELVNDIQVVLVATPWPEFRRLREVVPADVWILDPWKIVE